MKKCDYCGRENSDQSDECCECGTILPDHVVEKTHDQPQKSALLEWLGKSLFFAGTFIVMALLYLLSFGPVDRYCGKVVTKTFKSNTSTTSATNGFSAVTVVTVGYPVLVSIVYRPAVYLRVRSELYGRYIALWNRADD
jgi:hypothetical protein